MRILHLFAAVGVAAMVSACAVESEPAESEQAMLDGEQLDAAAVACPDGWFCIVVGGTEYRFAHCETFQLPFSWLGNAFFVNNKPPGTVARAWDVFGRPIWTNTAKASGTVDVTQWSRLRPC